jgi:hypothetical protein
MESSPSNFFRFREVLVALGTVAAVDVALTAVVVAVALAGPSECYRRWVPAVDRAQTTAMVLVGASVALLAWLLARRAGSLRAVPSKLSSGQALAVLLGAVLVVGGCESLAVMVRGPFEPTHHASAAGPDGKSAHLYRGGFWSCNHIVYVAEPGALTMTEVEFIERERCEGSFSVRWNADSRISVVDERGEPIKEQRNTLFPQKKLCPPPRTK